MKDDGDLTGDDHRSALIALQARAWQSCPTDPLLASLKGIADSLNDLGVRLAVEKELPTRSGGDHKQYRTLARQS